MELVAEKYAPILFQRRRFRRAEKHRHAGQSLGRDQRAFGAAVEVLRPPLRRQRAAVIFEVDLADPDRQILLRLVRAFDDPREPLGDVHLAHRRHCREVGELSVAEQHVLGRTAAAVAPAEQQQALRVALLVLKIPPRLDRGAWADPAVVAAGGVVVGMHQHARAIESFPPEKIGAELVLLRPVGLVGEETVEAGEAEKLRERRRESEAVRQPVDGGAPVAAEQPVEIADAV